MKQILKPILLMLPLLLAACDSTTMRDTLGLNRDAPDEFAVVSRPPLSLPPEFSLRPPKAGEAPLGTAADAQARSALIGKPVEAGVDKALAEPTVETAVVPVERSDVLSGGAANLLKRAGGAEAAENIREQLGADAVKPADTSTAKTLIDQLVGSEKNEPVVDAAKEAERLRANKDAGKKLTEGEVPEEKSKTRSLLDRIF